MHPKVFSELVKYIGILTAINFVLYFVKNYKPARKYLTLFNFISGKQLQTIFYNIYIVVTAT